ncbi:hypothetical protein IBL38_18770 [Pseudomonas syringae pv. syringae]|uniref:hypothetical protein n=1 Tax=Pseudomonas syringae TaxID=317 RepID=UPI001658D0A1|nr:hypothetical protein [Pseudomonas syringae]MBC9745026.1 hypothetical protein [Pseudomonas syringae pv. syringae]MBC9749334.1 hypothetical protein [Pseudomonas syringae pv. syringae]MCK9724228.1 hypothetical protein [Pseudomonas syringae pv. syringae]
MIKEIEALMVHWGEQRQRHGLGGGIGSQMGMIVEWKGMAPRGIPGHRILRAGLGMSYAAAEMDAALMFLGDSGEDGKKLVVLANSRYLYELNQTEQMRCIGLPAGAERTYRNWVHRLHVGLMRELNKKALTRAAAVISSEV